jgi:chromosome segregation ATPase
MFNGKDNSRLETTLVQLVTQVSESREATKDAINRTREDVQQIAKEIKKVEQELSEIKIQLSKGEGLFEEVKALRQDLDSNKEYYRSEIDAIKENCRKISTQVERLKEWQDEILEQQKNDERTFRDQLITYLTNGILGIIGVGAAFVVGHSLLVMRENQIKDLPLDNQQTTPQEDLSP